ncbi:hypothetical protein ATL17_1840 [Maritalea mobilis]|uniref:Uncharacterized protein n=1 Tax=Maritalea mobilis TaxID=483324 RepID=A0A4R6VNN2_9HYPH|nr:hypothetical protein [Maritalea mobilis]TDQ63832.1 hypothetical protein ATL17_1840 [Maritalea mobilis]
MKLSEAEWAAIKEAYEASNVRVVEICASYDISPATFYAYARRNNWAKRNHHKQKPKERDFRARLAALLDLKLDALEADLTHVKAADLTAIANLLKLFDKSTEKPVADDAGQHMQPEQVAAMRQRILNRIDALRDNAK